MTYIIQCKVFLYIVNYVRKRVQGFERHSWKRVEYSFVSEPFLFEAEYHYRSCASFVDYHFAAVRHKCLVPVDLKYVNAPMVEYLVDFSKLSLVDMPSFAAEKICKGLLGYVVLSWSKTSGSYYYIVVFQFII